MTTFEPARARALNCGSESLDWLEGLKKSRVCTSQQAAPIPPDPPATTATPLEKFLSCSGFAVITIGLLGTKFPKVFPTLLRDSPPDFLETRCE